MPANGLEITDDVRARERLHPFGQDVGAVVPDGFDAYARIDHAGRQGGPSDADLAPLAALLEAHTSTAAPCWFCLWAGYGWLYPGQGIGRLYRTRRRLGPFRKVALARARRRDARTMRADLPSALAERSQLHLQSREYYLFQGPVSAATAFRRHGPLGMWSDGPNLWWPADRTWCVASEIDLECTYVGGTKAAVGAVVSTDAWHAERVEVTHPIG